MEEEEDVFYVVRKGDSIGVYKSLSDCQAQAGTSVCDPPLSVYKGRCLPEKTKEYLSSHGLKNSLYSIHVSNMKDGLFGELNSCMFQQSVSSEEKISDNGSAQKRFPQVCGSEEIQPVSSTTKVSDNSSSRKKFPQVPNSEVGLCLLKFDGASKGNPGLAGAGAVLYNENGVVISQLCEGVGIATNNVAEYRGLILGLRHAYMRGFRHIRIQGDSKLVCMQVQGLWKTKNQNMADLCQMAKKLKDKFTSFQISHIERALNSDADAQANKAINLRDGQVQEEILG